MEQHQTWLTCNRMRSATWTHDIQRMQRKNIRTSERSPHMISSPRRKRTRSDTPPPRSPYTLPAARPPLRPLVRAEPHAASLVLQPGRFEPRAPASRPGIQLSRPQKKSTKKKHRSPRLGTASSRVGLLRRGLASGRRAGWGPGGPSPALSTRPLSARPWDSQRADLYAGRPGSPPADTDTTVARAGGRDDAVGPALRRATVVSSDGASGFGRFGGSGACVSSRERAGQTWAGKTRRRRGAVWRGRPFYLDIMRDDMEWRAHLVLRGYPGLEAV
ncbi:hypothetical protein C8Q80DRAFT_500155 [Daedaleopsis nitida]|nr:hypothetical protein C8Q80DRAFT_500155 [Daedaleopsis nitida]